MTDSPSASERGDTLIELLIAIAVIGICLVGLVGGLSAEIGSSSTHRSNAALDSVMRSLAETARYRVQNTPAAGFTGSTAPLFTQCASSYLLASSPFPRSGTDSTAVTVFGTGFIGNSGNPTVTLNGTAASNVTATVSNATYGDVTFNFSIPSTLAVGTYTVAVGDNGETASSSVPFVVTGPATGSTIETSPLAAYTAGISGINYWNGANFASNCDTTSGLNTDLQQIVLSGSSGAGAYDSAQIVVANLTPTKSAPGIKVAGTSTGAVYGATLTFTATITSPAGIRTAPTGAPVWTVVGPTPTTTTPCTSTPAPTTSGTTLTANCVVNCTVATPPCPGPPSAGSYYAVAAYPGDSNNFASTASSSPVTIGKLTPVVTAPTPAAGTNLAYNLTLAAPAGSGSVLPPSGSVTWTVTPTGGAPATSACAAPAANNVTALTASSATSSATTCTIGNAKLGTYKVSASYPGDTNYSSTAANYPTVYVTSLGITGALSPDKKTITWTATVTTPSDAPSKTPPTGNVTWSGLTTSGAGSDPSATCAAGAITVGGSGTSNTPLATTKTGTTAAVQCSVSGATNVTYSITATWPGDFTNPTFVYLPPTPSAQSGRQNG